MGVKSCDRLGCNNVMCDRIHNNKYICNECIEDFKSFVKTVGVFQADLNLTFDVFMAAHPKKTYAIESIDDFIESMKRS